MTEQGGGSGGFGADPPSPCPTLGGPTWPQPRRFLGGRSTTATAGAKPAPHLAAHPSGPEQVPRPAPVLPLLHPRRDRRIRAANRRRGDRSDPEPHPPQSDGHCGRLGNTRDRSAARSPATTRVLYLARETERSGGAAARAGRRSPTLTCAIVRRVIDRDPVWLSPPPGEKPRSDTEEKGQHARSCGSHPCSCVVAAAPARGVARPGDDVRFWGGR